MVDFGMEGPLLVVQIFDLYLQIRQFQSYLSVYIILVMVIEVFTRYVALRQLIRIFVLDPQP